jgi:hypothetical protein
LKPAVILSNFRLVMLECCDYPVVCSLQGRAKSPHARPHHPTTCMSPYNKYITLQHSYHPTTCMSPYNMHLTLQPYNTYITLQYVYHPTTCIPPYNMYITLQHVYHATTCADISNKPLSKRCVRITGACSRKRSAYCRPMRARLCFTAST